MSEKFEKLINNHIVKLQIGTYGHYGSNGNNLTTKSYLYVIIDKIDTLVKAKEMEITEEQLNNLKELQSHFNLKEYSNEFEDNLINFLSELDPTI